MAKRGTMQSHMTEASPALGRWGAGWLHSCIWHGQDTDQAHACTCTCMHELQKVLEFPRTTLTMARLNDALPFSSLDASFFAAFSMAADEGYIVFLESFSWQYGTMSFFCPCTHPVWD